MQAETTPGREPFPTGSGAGMRGRGNPRLLLGTAGLIVLLGIGGWCFHRFVVEDLTREALEKLEAVARLKVGQVAEWRQHLLGDVQANATGRFGMLVQQAARNGFDAGSLTLMRRRMEERQEYIRYRDLVLVGPDGDLLIRLRKDLPGLSEATRSLARQAWIQRKALLGEPRTARLEDSILEAACPVLGEDGTPLGVLVHQEDLDRLLFPLLETWPLPSRTAETQIVMREGDEALVLTRQRNRSDPPLTLRIPLVNREDLRVQAVQGTRGVLTGRVGPNGRPLFGYASTIPESRWVLVAWMDQEEVLAQARWIGGLVWGIVLLAMALTALLAWAAWRQGQGRLVRRVLEGERFRRRALEALRNTRGGGDGVLVVDARGRVVQMNLFAEHLTGWSGEEARGRPLQEVLALVEEPQDRGKGPDGPGAEASHPRTARMVARNGIARPIRMVTVPMPGEDGDPPGSVVVFRDRTGEEEAESRTREWESRYRSLFGTSLVGIAWLDAEGRVLEANRAFWDRTGRSPQGLEGLSWPDLVAPEDRDGARAIVDRLFSGLREPLRVDLRHSRPDGSVVRVRYRVQGIRDAGDRLVTILLLAQEVPGD